MNIIFDIGGTKIRIAGARTSDSFDTPIIFPTPQSYHDGLAQMKDAILKVSQGEQISRIAGGITGPFNEQTQTLIQSRNLPLWVDQPLARELSEVFCCPVSLSNDSAMVGLGEAVYGAGRGYSIVAYITVSTGVGGSRIVEGKLDERAIGFEPGKQIMNEKGETLEDLISGLAIEKRKNKMPIEITDEAFWDDIARILAQGLNNIIVSWSPNVVILGGSMMNNIGISLETTEKYVREMLTVFPTLPVFKKSELGDLGGLYGALAYLNQKP